MPPKGLDGCCSVGSSEDVLRNKIRMDLTTANRETQQFMQELISQQNIKMQKQIQALSDLVQEYITEVKQGGLNLAKKDPEEAQVLKPMCSADFTMHGRMSMMPRLDFNDSHHLARMEKASNTNPFRTFKTKKSLKTTNPAKMTFLQRVVHSKLWQVVTVSAIFGNILAMGVEVDYDITGALITPPTGIPTAFSVLNYIFLAIFAIELVIKIAAYKADFIRGDDHAWNLFDGFLVLSQAVEVLLESSSVGGIRAIRILRLVRTLRVIRLFHFFRELRMMVVCIFNSLMSLFWAMTLLVTVTYVFAILTAQGAATWLRDPNPWNPTSVTVVQGGDAELAGAYQTDILSSDGLRQQITVHFESLLRTMLSLMMAVTGGCDWYQIAKPLMNMSYFYFSAFLFYVLLIVLCIMNVLSALFVEMALQIKDRDLLIQAELAKIDAFLKDMRDLFDEVDVDGNGFVTRIELSTYMKNERVMAYFGGQGLDMSDVGLMFDLLDSSHDGTIGQAEFLLGTLRLKGGARCIEVMRLFQALDHIRKELGTVQQKLHIEPGEFEPSKVDDGETARLSQF
eukprot:symbB.v1.2.008206.t1/scaffold492.1/size196413/9